MRKIAIVLVMFLVGCVKHTNDSGSPSPTSTPVIVALQKAIKAADKPKGPTDKEKISLLRTEAHKRGLTWYVICFDSPSRDPGDTFFAAAFVSAKAMHATYIEDGAEPWWAEHGASQADAAYALYKSIQQMPNVHPDHKPVEEHEHKYCPPELRGN
jgi:hypothetical protein